MENGDLPIYLLTDQKIDGVENYPVIKINFLSPSFSFENIDYLIFTSKNGVRAVNNLTDEWKKYPSLAIGKATAEEIEKLGGGVEYIAKSAYGDEFAKEINKIYKNKTFLFFRAKKIVSDIQKEFINNTLKEVIVYETVCNTPAEKLKKPSVVIFTSPSTVICFSKINGFNNIKAVAIGNKTKNCLSEYIDEIYIPSTPSVTECVNLAKTLKIR
ncbi:uroporphyrinogen-III synthase [Nautilia sp.]